MFPITEDPSSGSLVQCLAKNYKNGSIVSVDMDRVGDIYSKKKALKMTDVCAEIRLHRTRCTSG